MKNFNFSRFLGVARWDLTVNRQFYTRMLIVVGGIIIIPVLFKYVIALWGLIAMGADREAYTVANSVDSLSVVASFLRFSFPLIMTVLMGYMFHNLLTKQGRINELTLPATNLERFLWHVCCTVLGGILACLLSLLVADVAHVILGWAILGQRSFTSLFLTVFDNFTTVNLVRADNDYISVMAGLFLGIIGLLNFSYFALGNAWKYRHNIAYTLLWIVGLTFVISTLIGFVMAFLIGSSVISEETIEAFFEKLPHLSEEVVITVIVLLEAAFLCFVWWLTYRLYCKAQITTRRNP